ncbi:MAG: hypothetical protein ABI036_12895 [Fibrobacteria bacterium]
MFVHLYRARVLNQIKLLWFTTLSVLVVKVNYLTYVHFMIGR